MVGETELVFRKAEECDREARMSLYRSLLGFPGCGWNEEYPSIEDVDNDISARCLYCISLSGRIVAAARSGADSDTDLFPLDSSFTRVCELSRVGVALDMQGQGIAQLLIKNIFQEMITLGFDGICLLVDTTNPSAIALYEKLGFTRCWRTFMYGRDFYCYQRSLNTPTT